jgi:O-methyltransferase involved in polyketide biosynthesis
VLDFTWMDRVNPQDGVFVTAEGLLPYLQPHEAISAIRECARRFPGGQMMFDLPPKVQAVPARHRMWKRYTPDGRGRRLVSPSVRLPSYRTPCLPVHRLVGRLVGISRPTIARR